MQILDLFSNVTWTHNPNQEPSFDLVKILEHWVSNVYPNFHLSLFIFQIVTVRRKWTYLSFQKSLKVDRKVHKRWRKESKRQSWCAPSLAHESQQRRVPRKPQGQPQTWSLLLGLKWKAVRQEQNITQESFWVWMSGDFNYIITFANTYFVLVCAGIWDRNRLHAACSKWNLDTLAQSGCGLWATNRWADGVLVPAGPPGGLPDNSR